MIDLEDREPVGDIGAAPCEGVEARSQDDVLIDAGADGVIKLLFGVSRPDQEAATGVHHSHRVAKGEPVEEWRPDDPSPGAADQFDGELVFKDYRMIVEKMRRPVGRDPLGGPAALIGFHEPSSSTAPVDIIVHQREQRNQLGPRHVSYAVTAPGRPGRNRDLSGSPDRGEIQTSSRSRMAPVH
jgi:hypothetical protein